MNQSQYIDWGDNGSPSQTFVQRRRCGAGLDLCLIKVDNKLSQLQLVLDDAVDGWWLVVSGGGELHTDGARHYFLFIVLFY